MKILTILLLCQRKKNCINYYYKSKNETKIFTAAVRCLPTLHCILIEAQCWLATGAIAILKICSSSRSK
jgi:hypothetical protein